MENKIFSIPFLEYASKILGETNKGFSTAEIIRYCNSYSVQFNVEIPITSLEDKYPNKRTILLENLKKFSSTTQFFILSELCEISDIEKNPEVMELKGRLYEKYGELSPNKSSNELLIIKTKNNLKIYEKSYEKYKEGIKNFDKKGNNRHILDDMRFSLESLLKEILNNKKSLENQIPILGESLEEKNISIEIRNLFTQVIRCYCKYQNENVKHNDKISEFEVKFIIEQTSVFINFIIDTLGNKKSYINGGN